MIRVAEKGSSASLAAMWSAYHRSTSSGVENPSKTLTSPHGSSWGFVYTIEKCHNESGEGVAQSVNLVQTLDYYPYGAMRISNSTSTNEQRKYINRFSDQSGLDYFVNRYYSSDRGQFISQDPTFLSAVQQLADPQSLNSYSYANDNPITGKDPLGLFNQKTGQIDKGDTLGGITGILNQQYGTNLTVGQVASANNIQNANRIYAGSYIALPGQNAQLNFNGRQLSVFDKTYSSPVPSLSWSGVSGSPIRGYPPIPAGNYKADPANTQYWKDVGTLNKVVSTISGFTEWFGLKKGAWPGGTFAWGDTRTELSNSDTGVQKTGYYIHGGAIPGSAGCIDLTGQNNSFQSWLTGYGKPVDLSVKY